MKTSKGSAGRRPYGLAWAAAQGSTGRRRLCWVLAPAGQGLGRLPRPWVLLADPVADDAYAQTGETFYLQLTG